MNNKELVLKQILDKITPHKDYLVEDYYGVSLIKMKRTGYYNIKLIYGYDKYSKMSSELEIKEIKKALIIYELLDEFSVDKRDKVNTDDIDLDMMNTSEEAVASSEVSDAGFGGNNE